LVRRFQPSHHSRRARNKICTQTGAAADSSDFLLALTGPQWHVGNCFRHHLSRRPLNAGRLRTTAPVALNWDFWRDQTPVTDYVPGAVTEFPLRYGDYSNLAR